MLTPAQVLWQKNQIKSWRGGSAIGSVAPQLCTLGCRSQHPWNKAGFLMNASNACSKRHGWFPVYWIKSQLQVQGETLPQRTRQRVVEQGTDIVFRPSHICTSVYIHTDVYIPNTHRYTAKPASNVHNETAFLKPLSHLVNKVQIMIRICNEA